MSVNITQAFIRQYTANVILLSQQKGSRFRDKVRMAGDITADRYFFERLGKTAAVKKLSRGSDTPLIDSDHSRRMVTLVDYEWADLVDKEDKVRILINPESEYAQAAAWAVGRAVDDEVIAALFGPSLTGVDGSTSVNFPSANVVANAAAGLNLAKLISARQLLNAADVDPDDPQFIAIKAVHLSDLLNTTEVKNVDYNSVHALVKGEVDTFMGFKFFLSNRLLGSTAYTGTPDTNATTLLPAWSRNGIGLAIAADLKVRITERADKSYSVQVYVASTLGATRVEDEKVIAIGCND